MYTTQVPIKALIFLGQDRRPHHAGLTGEHIVPQGLAGSPLIIG